MSKSYSYLFSGTRVSVTHDKSVIKSVSHGKLKSWAKHKMETLKGKAKSSFNTACIVYDETTGKCYYGRNGGYNAEGYEKNPILFGDDTHEGILPKNSLNKFPVGNCAEVDAINNALNDGAQLKNLHITTINATKKKFGTYKPSCENCKHTFKGKVKENYSGWVED